MAIKQENAPHLLNTKVDYGEAAPMAPVRRPWSSRWKAPAMMIFGLLAGVGFGLGHHQYYKHFDGTIVKSNNQQQWALRIGTGLAFLTKTAFTGVIGIAFSQYLWATARRKALTLRSLDAAFTLTSSPTSFFDISVLKRAKLLTLVGIISWLLPLIALVTPATLTVESRLMTNVTKQPVPYPDFDNTNGINSLGNINGNIWSDYMGVGVINSASPAVTRLLTAVSSAMSIAYVAAPYENSSYSIQFYGPCLKCQYMDEALRSHDFDNLKQMAGDDTTLSKLWNDFPRLGYTGLYYNASAPIYNVILIATGAQNLAANTGGVNITCQFRNASYNVDFTFEQGIPSTTISNLILEPALDYSTHQLITYLPQNGSRAYLSMLIALGQLLKGLYGFQQGLSSGGMTGGTLPIVATGLLACPEIIGAWDAFHGFAEPPLNETSAPWMCRNGSLKAAIEDLSHNFTLSLLSSASFSTSRLVDVSYSFPLNHYAYHPRDLAISYLTGLGVTLGCFLIGAWACQSNGYSASTSFSTILHTTRNSQLDELARTDSDGAEGRKDASRTVKLQYGFINQEGEMGHAAFGKADTITRVARL